MARARSSKTNSAGKTAIIIGAGIGGLGTAALLSKAGCQVTVFEKNEQAGGRASLFHADWDKQQQRYVTRQAGQTPPKARLSKRSRQEQAKVDSFTFDAGPSWYLMPDVFEHFFTLLGEDVNQHLAPQRLDPSYRVYYKDTFRKIDIYSDFKRDLPTIEQIEPGAGVALRHYLDKAAYQYGIAKDRFMYKNYDSISDFFTKEMVTEGRKLNVLGNMNRYVSRYFKTDAMRKLMQYPLVFLGSSPYSTPAIYNIMSHIDFNLGVYYPQNGIYSIVRALRDIAEKHGATIKLNSSVEQIVVEDSRAVGIRLADGKEHRADIIISNADIEHTEQKLLAEPYREKTERYWRSRTVAPSALIIYLGVKGELPQLTHHNLLFSKDWKKNFDQIFKKPLLGKPRFPSDPSLYLCNPSKTDPSLAPAGHENLFVLVPIAAGLEYTETELETYVDKVLQTIESEMRLPKLRQNIVYQRLFCVKDFASRYNSYRGSALGLAHTLRQTAIFRPNNVSRKVSNLYYVGANTNPGGGMPTCLISAELVYKRLIGDKSAGPLRPEQLH